MDVWSTSNFLSQFFPKFCLSGPAAWSLGPPDVVTQAPRQDHSGPATWSLGSHGLVTWAPTEKAGCTFTGKYSETAFGKLPEVISETCPRNHPKLPSGGVQAQFFRRAPEVLKNNLLETSRNHFWALPRKPSKMTFWGPPKAISVPGPFRCCQPSA